MGSFITFLESALSRQVQRLGPRLANQAAGVDPPWTLNHAALMGAVRTEQATPGLRVVTRDEEIPT